MIFARRGGHDCLVVTSVDILDPSHHRPAQARYVIPRQDLTLTVVLEDCPHAPSRAATYGLLPFPRRPLPLPSRVVISPPQATPLPPMEEKDSAPSLAKWHERRVLSDWMLLAVEVYHAALLARPKAQIKRAHVKFLQGFPRI
jgi:hypothetical protein